MDEVKDKVKGFVKKLNNPFAPSSARFKGEGHRLGNAQPNNTAGSNGPEDWRRSQQDRWERERQRPGYGGPKDKQPPSVPMPQSSTSDRPLPLQDSSKPLQQSTNKAAASSPNPGLAPPSDATASTAFIPVETPYPLQENSNRYASTEDLASASAEPSNLQMLDASNEAGISKALQDQSIGSHFSEVVTTTQDERPERSSGFDPFVSHIASTASGRNHGELQMFQCPVCGKWWNSENEVNAHVDECLNQGSQNKDHIPPDSDSGQEQVRTAVEVLLSGGPSNDALDVMSRILRNITNSPETEKFRKIRLSNPKIHESIGMALGGVELLEAVGFSLQTEGDEIWAVMDLPSADQIKAMNHVIAELEIHMQVPGSAKNSENDQNSKETKIIQRKVDRKVRVFYAAAESLAAKMDIPDSFFQLSASELRQEAAARKKKLEDSQQLVPKSYKEKMAAEKKRKYKAAMIRIQFPDGVILQGMFLPTEQTTALYEFVSTSLRDPSIRFDLVAPILRKNEIVPAFADGIKQVPTLEEANLVPATLVKFQCVEADATTFTGLHPNLLAIIEPL